MVDKSPDKILYELEYFGVPTRDGSLAEAHKLVQIGQLSQEQIDEACGRYQSRIEAENVRKYGTSSPTQEDKDKFFNEIVREGMAILAQSPRKPNFVKMYDGLYSEETEIYTKGLVGCVASILYFEGHGKKGGILTHCPAYHGEKNLEKLRKLKDRHLDWEINRLRGVLLVEEVNNYTQKMKKDIEELFGGIEIQFILYDQNRIGRVSLNPSQNEWRTEQHGNNSF